MFEKHTYIFFKKSTLLFLIKKPSSNLLREQRHPHHSLNLQSQAFLKNLSNQKPQYLATRVDSTNEIRFQLPSTLLFRFSMLCQLNVSLQFDNFNCAILMIRMAMVPANLQTRPNTPIETHPLQVILRVAGKFDIY